MLTRDFTLPRTLAGYPNPHIFMVNIPIAAQATPRARARAGAKGYYAAPARGSKVLDYASYKQFLVYCILNGLSGWEADHGRRWPQDKRYGLHVVIAQHKASKDWDNLGKAISDAGEGLLWANDRQIDDAHVIRRLVPKDAVPCIEIVASTL